MGAILDEVVREGILIRRHLSRDLGREDILITFMQLFGGRAYLAEQKAVQRP